MSEMDDRQSYCRVVVAGIPLPYVNVKNVVVREWITDAVPTIRLQFVAAEEFFGGITLQEDDLIEVEISSRQPDKKELPLHMTFRLKTHTIDKEQELTRHDMAAIIACTNLSSPSRWKSYPSCTSTAVLRQLAKTLSLKIDVRKECNDSQTWLQHGTSLEMLKHLREYSYVAEDDLPLAYIGRDSIVVATSVNQQLRDEPLRLLYWPEAFGDDVEPMDVSPENRMFPFTGFSYKSLSALHNMEGGYGFKEYTFDGQRYYATIHDSIVGSMAALHNMRADLKGQVNDVLDTEAPSSAHPHLMLAPRLNAKHRLDMMTGIAVVCLRPHVELRLGRAVTLAFNMNSRGEKSELDGIYGGRWIIGGIITSHQHPVGSRMYCVLFRGGAERGYAMQDTDVTAVRT